MNYRNHFTSRAIKAIEFAQYAARELEQDYIGTEHILLGLLHEEGSVAFAALQAAGLTFICGCRGETWCRCGWAECD